jgi:hypothetical protein
VEQQILQAMAWQCWAPRLLLLLSLLHIAAQVEGMILPSELSWRRIRSINKLIRVRGLPWSLPAAHGMHGGLLCLAAVQVGRQEPVMVLRLDKDKGYIDLSKRCGQQTAAAPAHSQPQPVGGSAYAPGGHSGGGGRLCPATAAACLKQCIRTRPCSL